MLRAPRQIKPYPEDLEENPAEEFGQSTQLLEADLVLPFDIDKSLESCFPNREHHMGKNRWNNLILVSIECVHLRRASE